MNDKNPSTMSKQELFEFLDNDHELSKDFIRHLSDENLAHWQEYYQLHSLIHDDVNEKSLTVNVSDAVMREVKSIELDVSFNTSKSRDSSVNGESSGYYAQCKAFFSQWSNPLVSVASVGAVFVVLSFALPLFNSSQTTVNDVAQQSNTDNYQTISEKALPMEYYMMYGNYGSDSSFTHQLAAFTQVLN